MGVQIDCRWYDGTTTRSRRTTVTFHADDTVVRGEPAPCTSSIQDLSISEPLGRLPRRITFPDGGVCETDDHAGLERALCNGDARAAGRWVHHLESRWGWAAVALVLSVALVYLAIDDGMPWLAGRIAPNIPDSACSRLGERALQAFDESVTEPSKLPQARREALRHRFAELTAWADPGIETRLEFRNAPGIGANAFALPGGIVVITDQLVELAGNDDEIVAVLAHEIGHVAHRHGLRKALQNTGISVIVIAVTGDVSWLATTIPTTLLAARYSRAYEREADRYAGRYMKTAGIPPRNLVDLLRRVRRESGSSAAPGLFASHPGIEERAEMLHRQQ